MLFMRRSDKEQGSSSKKSESRRVVFLCDRRKYLNELVGFYHQAIALAVQLRVTADFHQSKPESRFPRFLPAYLDAIEEILATESFLRLEIVRRDRTRRADDLLTV